MHSKFSSHLLTLTLGLLALAGLGSSAWAANKKAAPAPVPTAPAYVGPRYFFTIDLDSRYQIVGTGALTETAAAKSNCYRFTYDATGKLIQIDYRRAGSPTPDPFLGVPSIGFEYSPGIERRWFRDGQSQPISNLDGIQGEELALNAAGYPVSVTNLNKDGGKMRDGSGVIRYMRTLDNAFRLVQGRRGGLLGTDITDDNGYFETRTNYDNQSRRIEYANYDSSGNPLNNRDGVATVRTTYTVDPDVLHVSKSFFDANGIAASERNSGAHEIRRTFDHRGFMLSEAYFDTTGAPMLDLEGEIHERRYVYDELGNKISEAFFDTLDRSMDQKLLGYARVVYEYDKKNRVYEIAYYGADGAPQIPSNVGAAVMRQEYDDQGNIVRLQFFDGEGKPAVSAKYGAVAIRILVDGPLTIVTLRDDQDKPTRNIVNGVASFSYKTATDKPLTRTNQYYNRFGYPIAYFPRVSVINPHLYAMRNNLFMQNSARYGAGAVGIGALLGAFLAIRKSSYTRRRKIYVPSPLERLLGWLAVFAIFEGLLRFFLTVYWWWLNHKYAYMGHTIYVIEAIIIVFFLYRLQRMRVTMRVLNIEREDVHRMVRDFFAKAHLQPEWLERRRSYCTLPLDVRIRYFRQKYHSYLAFRRRGREGRDLARALAQYIRSQVRGVQAPERSRWIALYYPSVALCYFLLSGTAFYTLWQLIKRY